MKRRHVLFYPFLFSVGCAAVTGNAGIQSQTPALKSLDKLRFTVTDTGGIEELQRDYDTFRIALEQTLEIPVEFFPVETYFDAAAALQSNAVDLVWAGPSEYVVIKARTNAALLVELPRPEYYTVIWVRADSGIQTLADLKGKTLDIRKNGSTGSHLGAIKLLIDAGLNPQTDINIIASGEYSAKSLDTGAADAMALTPYRYRNVLDTLGSAEADYPVIATGQPFPGDAFIASSHLEAARQIDIKSKMLAHQNQLIQAILSVDNLSFRFQGSKLVPANDTHYNVIRQVYEAIGQGDFIQ
ncbi:MAG: PhnD/SsuA/transferrin family substrate-binding protein [Cyanothece sp. SIO2G6]|nr:PhnD/SsuA/transferrin family substrate-binding protein [Cyanothece sp. SIO2G6]